MKNESRIEELLADLLRTQDRQTGVLEKQGTIMEKHSTILEKHSTIMEKQGTILEKHSMLLEHLVKGQDKLSDQFERLFTFIQDSMMHRMDEMDARIRKLEGKG